MTSTLPAVTGEVGYALRLPPELKAWLEAQAKVNRRSLNSEIVFRLEQSRESEERRKR